MLRAVFGSGLRTVRGIVVIALFTGASVTCLVLWQIQAHQRLDFRIKPPYRWAGGYVLSAAISSGSRVISVINSDDNVNVINVQSGKVESSIPCSRSHAFSTAFSPDGRTLAIAQDSCVLLYDMRRGLVTTKLVGVPDILQGLVFSKDGGRLFGGLGIPGFGPGRVQMWDVRTGYIMRTFLGHSLGVTALALSADNKTIASGSANEIIIWDIATGSPIRTYHRKNCREPHAICFSPNGRAIAVGAYRELSFYNVQSSDDRTSVVNPNDWIHGLVFIQDGSAVVSAGSDGKLQLWDPKNGKLIIDLAQLNSPILSVSLSDGEHKVLCVTLDGKIHAAQIPATKSDHSFAITEERRIGALGAPHSNTVKN
jgi:WD40 repeat protein